MAEDADQTRYTSYYLEALNQAQTQFVLDTKCLYKDAPTITVVSGTAAYNLPTDFMLERQVEHKGLELLPISRATLGYYKTSDRWDDDEGVPRYYCIDPEEARKTMLLFPIPQGDDAGSNLVLTYYPKPTDLAADSDVPFNSYALLAQYHMAIPCWAAWLLLGYAVQTPEIATKRNGLLKQYADQVTQCIDNFGNTKSEPIRIKGGRYWR